MITTPSIIINQGVWYIQLAWEYGDKKWIICPSFYWRTILAIVLHWPAVWDLTLSLEVGSFAPTNNNRECAGAGRSRSQVLSAVLLMAAVGGWQRTEHWQWLLLLMLLKQYKYHNGHNYKANLDGSNIAILCTALVLTRTTHVQCTN